MEKTTSLCNSFTMAASVFPKVWIWILFTSICFFLIFPSLSTSGVCFLVSLFDIYIADHVSMMKFSPFLWMLLSPKKDVALLWSDQVIGSTLFTVLPN